MDSQSCCGFNPAGAFVAVGFNEAIESVDSVEPTNDYFVAPGFIDIQVNGFAGVDFNSPRTTAADISRATRTIRQSGVTRYFPTVITGAPDSMAACLRNLAAARETIPERSSITAFHVEGPHISPDDGPRGAHPREWVCAPDVHLFHRLQDAAGGHIRLVTVSPHWPEAPHYIEALVRVGVVVSLGHTNANAQQIDDCVRAGATMSTHIGNGADAVLRRHPNYLWDQLADDRLFAGMIADGIHLGAAFLKVAVRAKGAARSVLVTDASAPAGCAPGRYRLGQLDVDLTADGRVVMAGQERLAGSALHMHRAIQNVMDMTGVPFADAVEMATTNPARACHIADRQKGLSPDDAADLVLLKKTEAGLEIQKVWVSGELVYRS